MVRLGLGVLVRKTTEVKGPSHCIRSKVPTVNRTSLLALTLITWFSVRWVSPPKVTPPPLSISYIWKEVTMQSSQLGWSISINYLEFFCMGDLSILSHLPIYSITYLYQCGLTDTYFVLRIQYCVIYLSTQIVPALATGRSSRQLLCPFAIPHHPGFFGYFLPSGTIRRSMFTMCLPSPSRRISHFSKEPWFLLLENGIRNPDLGAGHACCHRGVIASGPSQATEQSRQFFFFFKLWNTVNASTCRCITRQVAGLINGTDYSPDPSFTRGLEPKLREGTDGTYTESQGTGLQERPICHQPRPRPVHLSRAPSPDLVSGQRLSHKCA